jgi:hypothetical protein
MSEGRVPPRTGVETVSTLAWVVIVALAVIGAVVVIGSI